MSEMQILHIADVHLGGSGPAFGSRVRAHQIRMEEAFARAVDLAVFNQVAAVCIVGDLFYDPRPSEHAVQIALREIGRLCESQPAIPCFIVPGNHDCLDPRGVYTRPEWRREGIHVYTEPGSPCLPDGSIAFHASPHRCDTTEHRPLKGLAPDPGARFNVALVHGAIVMPGVNDGETVPIMREEIGACGMDYVALGHWHDPSDYSTGGVTARYSGATEIVGIPQREQGGALLVTLSDSGVSATRETTGSLRFEAIDLDPEAHPDETAIAVAIAARANPDLLLDVTVTGLAPEGFTCDLARLQEDLSPSFFRLRVSDETIPALAEVAPESLREHLIAARAINLFQKRIDAARAEGDERRADLTRRAMQIAVALFQGKEVLP